MNKNLFWLRPVFGILVLVNLMGLTGRERYIELEAFLNGRSEARFRAEDRNVRAVLSKGTRAEILQSKQLSSGNYAMYVKTLNGSYQGQGFWVYYNVDQPALKVYEQPPADWGTQKPAAETRKDVEAYKAPATPHAGMALPPTRPVPQAGQAGGSGRDNATQVLRQFNDVDRQVRGAGQPPQAPYSCASCAGANPQQVVANLLAGPTRKTYVDNACHNIMKPNGAYGEWGLKMAHIMNEPQYRDHYLNGNALGEFCPKFASMSREMKLKAWTWFWTVLAMRESSCELTKEHPTHVWSRRQQRMIYINPNLGYGLWAAEKDRNLRADRGPGCSNIASFEGQARCAVDTMFKTQLRRGQTASNSDLKYWGPTYNARRATEIAPRMRRFTACF